MEEGFPSSLLQVVDLSHAMANDAVQVVASVFGGNNGANGLHSDDCQHGCDCDLFHDFLQKKIWASSKTHSNEIPRVLEAHGGIEPPRKKHAPRGVCSSQKSETGLRRASSLHIEPIPRMANVKV